MITMKVKVAITYRKGSEARSEMGHTDSPSGILGKGLNLCNDYKIMLLK